MKTKSNYILLLVCFLWANITIAQKTNNWNIIDTGDSLIAKQISTGDSFLIAKNYHRERSAESTEDTLSKESYSEWGEYKCLYLLGPYLSYYSYESSGTETLNSSFSENYRTINLNNRSFVSLTVFFDTVTIFHAVMDNPIVIKSIEGDIPKNYHDLVDNLYAKTIYPFDKLFQSYAFTEVTRQNITVQFLLSAEARAFAGASRRFSVKLPTPTLFKNYLNKSFHAEFDDKE